ncbi:hypothetical protein L2712_04530 [Shewanella marisflavi]|uniref:hypothetical protein n=1 Tax=Shewanella marisflavi TaxID=260364 RepID=UPI00200F605F|nr:hypothetical protein [Shewanella marisflavi]MCL1040921.1 hypothetical protein [Shewanella marisflavi]
MTPAFNHQYLKWSIYTLVVFIFLQSVLSFSFGNDFLSIHGFLHLFVLVLYFVLVYLSLKSNVQVSIFYIVIYQIYFTLALYFYYSALGTPLGIGIPDALFYDQLARESVDLSIYDSIIGTLSSHDLGDLGFTQLTRIIYMFPGEPVINMKLVNVFLHILSGIFLFKTARLLKFDITSAKFITVLFCLNPASLYFNSTGLKEASFLFVVTISIYLCYAAVHKKSLICGALGIISIVSTAFFRVPYPLFLLFGFSVYFYGVTSGRFKIVIKLLIIILLPFVLAILWSLLKSSLELWFALDLGRLQAHRLGKESVGLVEYILLILVGLIGPIPSFNYELSQSSSILLTIPNFIKMCLSGYFIISIFEVVKFREFQWYPLLIVFFINFLMLVIAASTFDMRYVYPIMPVFYLLAGRKLIDGFELKSPLFLGYMLLCTLLIVLYNLR